MQGGCEHLPAHLFTKTRCGGPQDAGFWSGAASALASNLSLSPEPLIEFAKEHDLGHELLGYQ